MTILRRLLLVFLCLIGFAAWVRPAAAQLAKSFYNIVGIDTRVLPNGLQITVRADGVINMGVDRNEFLDIDPTGRRGRSARSLDSFRLRFVGARAQIPAFTDIGSYPADFVETSLGRDELTGTPFFYGGRRDPSKTDPTLPRVDLRFHFYIPIKVTYFTFIYGDQYGWNLAYTGMQPREVSIAVGEDRRSVIITVISDRVEIVRSQARLNRSPVEGHHHRLRIDGGADDAPLHVDALHEPLADVADGIARATGVPLVVPAAEAATDVSLFLPAANRDDTLRALARACGLVVQPRSPADGGGAVLARGGSPGSADTTERIRLHHLRPENARLLLPDFLLPYLRVDSEHNALVVSAAPDVTARIRRDLALLDLPRPQVRVEATVYEMQRSDSDSLTAQLSLAGGRPSLDTSVETLSVTVQPGQAHNYAASLAALVARGRARLVARPSLTVVSGEVGTLFAGQTRYITILQTDYSSGGGQNVEAVQLPVGTTLTVTPTASAPATDSDIVPIVLDLSASVATVDSLDIKTGLPTVGTRQVAGVVRLSGDGDAILIAGLTSADQSHVERHFAAPLSWLPILGPVLAHLTRSHDDEADHTELLVLVTARIVGDSDSAAKRQMEKRL